MSLAPRRALSAIGLTLGALGLLWVHRHLWRGEVMLGRDLRWLFIPETAWLAERLRHFELPLWNPSMRLGQPFSATLYAQAFYPPRVLAALCFSPAWAMALLHLFHAAVALVGTFLAARASRLPERAAWLAGAAFALTPLFLRLGETENVASAASYSGVLLWAALRLKRAASPRALATLAAALAASVLAGSPETVLWQGLMLALVLGPSAWGAAAVALGLVVSAVSWVPGLELAAQAAPATMPPWTWSVSLSQVLSMGWLFAEEPRGVYWGEDQWFISSLFVGTLTCAFAVAGWLRGRRAWVPAALAAACLLLALGPHALWEAPPLKLFRYPAKFAVGLSFALALLAGHGLVQVRALLRRRALLPLRWGAVVAAGLLVWVAAPRAVALLPLRAGVAAGATWTVGFLVLGLLVATAPWPRVRRWLVACALAELALAHLLLAPTGVGPESALPTGAATAALLVRDGVGRISVEPDDAPDSPVKVRGEWYLFHGLRAAEGYGFREPRLLAAALEGAPRGSYDAFGVTHFLRTGAAPFADLEALGANADAVNVYRSRTAQPRAWVVQRAEVATEERALTELRAGNVREVVWLGTVPSGTVPASPKIPTPPCPSTVTLDEPRPELLRAHVTACADGWLVVSDAYSSGWVVRVDDVDVELLRANAVMRAVRVSKGEHQVEFEYASGWFRAGAWLSLLGVAIVALCAARSERPRSTAAR